MFSPHRRRCRARDERGVVIILTSIAMIALISFAALAVDMGVRNQYLARDQHSIDAATLAASYSLNVNGASDSDRYNKASRIAKELIAQNMGVSTVDWNACKDSENLAKAPSLGTIAPDDSSIGNECISFAVNSEGRDVVRIILPDHSMKTIFGGVTGNQRINLSAIANSDGSSCTALADPSTCGPPPPVSTPGSTAPAPDYPSWCADIGHNVWFFAYEWTYDHCQAYFHNTRDLTD